MGGVGRGGDGTTVRRTGGDSEEDKERAGAPLLHGNYYTHITRPCAVTRSFHSR